MDYLKLQWPYVTSKAWRQAPCAARGAAVSLLGYCFREENGGRIVGCLKWDREDWRAAADLRPLDIAMAVGSGLAKWDGPDLLVDGYDSHGQESLETARAQGHHGVKGAVFGHLGGRPRKHPPHETPIGGNDKTPIGGNDKTPPVIPDQTRPDQTTAASPPAPGVIQKKFKLGGPDRKPENLDDLAGLVAAFGGQAVEAAAVRWLADHGEKPYPNEIGPGLAQAKHAATARQPPPELPDVLPGGRLPRRAP